MTDFNVEPSLISSQYAHPFKSMFLTAKVSVFHLTKLITDHYFAAVSTIQFKQCDVNCKEF